MAIVGSTVTLTGRFYDAAGDPTDPTSVVASIRDPDGTVTTPAVANTAVGVYTAIVDVDQPGIWFWQWDGTTGDDTQTDQGTICVVGSSMTEVVS